MKKIYFFRHGETYYNKINKVQGQLDIGLDEAGVEQAKNCANFLSDKGIQIIYSSPLSRAYETAKYLADQIKVNIIEDDGLKEMNAGKYQGRLKNEIIEEFGEEKYKSFCCSSNKLLDDSYPDGETRNEMRKRFFKTIEKICKNEEHDIIGVATHGHILREFLFNMGFQNTEKLKNCECIEVEYENEKFNIICRMNTQQETSWREKIKKSTNKKELEIGI